jgi:hypothetical protein
MRPILVSQYDRAVHSNGPVECLGQKAVAVYPRRRRPRGVGRKPAASSARASGES